MTQSDCLAGFGCVTGTCVAVDGGQSTPLLSCAQMSTCVLGCSTNLNCQVDCYNRGTPQAKLLSNAIAVCVSRVCVTTDAAVGRCTAYPGDFSTDCQVCVDNSGLGWSTAYPCMPASDPACNQCGQQVSACLADA
jgi:hypothetical protein